MSPACWAGFPPNNVCWISEDSTVVTPRRLVQSTQTGFPVLTSSESNTHWTELTVSDCLVFTPSSWSSCDLHSVVNFGHAYASAYVHAALGELCIVISVFVVLWDGNGWLRWKWFSLSGRARLPPWEEQNWVGCLWSTWRGAWAPRSVRVRRKVLVSEFMGIFPGSSALLFHSCSRSLLPPLWAVLQVQDWVSSLENSPCRIYSQEAVLPPEISCVFPVYFCIFFPPPRAMSLPGFLFSVGAAFPGCKGQGKS